MAKTDASRSMRHRSIRDEGVIFAGDDILSGQIGLFGRIVARDERCRPQFDRTVLTSKFLACLDLHGGKLNKAKRASQLGGWHLMGVGAKPRGRFFGRVSRGFRVSRGRLFAFCLYRRVP